MSVLVSALLIGACALDALECPNFSEVLALVAEQCRVIFEAFALRALDTREVFPAHDANSILVDRGVVMRPDFRSRL